MRVKITDIIERDTDRVLFGGTRENGDRITFHVRGEQAAQMADLVESGEHVEADM